MRVSKISYFIIIAVFVAAVIIAWIPVIEQAGYKGRADGVVTGVRLSTMQERYKDKNGHTWYRDKVYYYPTIEYVTETGQVFEKESKVGTNSLQFEEGETVLVKYDLNNPERFSVVGDSMALMFAIVFSAMLVMMIFLTAKRKI